LVDSFSFITFKILIYCFILH